MRFGAFSKRCLAVAALLLLCTSCKEPEQALPAPIMDSAHSSKEYKKNYDRSGSLTFTAPGEDVLQKGRTLLQELNVQVNQTVRFSMGELTFDTHGTQALTSLEEARRLYPDWHIPEKLGPYRFADLTVHKDRTDIVFIDMPPLDQPSVTTDAEPGQYYLCYRKGSSRFRIDVMPIDPEDRESFDPTRGNEGMTPWPAHPEVYLQLDETVETAGDKDGYDTPRFFSLFILTEPAGENDYAYFVCKLKNPTDCLENDFENFSEKEAQSIYQAMQKDLLPNAKGHGAE